MKKILIYGGSSLISIELIKIIYEEVDKLIIFCRNEMEFKEKIKKLYLDENKFEIKETDLENLDDNLVKIEALEDLKEFIGSLDITEILLLKLITQKTVKKY